MNIIKYKIFNIFYIYIVKWEKQQNPAAWIKKR